MSKEKIFGSSKSAEVHSGQPAWNIIPHRSRSGSSDDEKPIKKLELIKKMGLKITGIKFDPATGQVVRMKGKVVN